MNPSAYKVAMLYMSQNQEDSSNEDPSVIEKNDNAKLTLSQKKKVIEDSLDTYYSSVINAYLRKYNDISELVFAASSVISQFGDGNNSEAFSDELNNLKVKILNAVGDIAMRDSGSLKSNILNDPKTSSMSSDELEDYIRSILGNIRRDASTKVKKIKSYLY